MPRSVFWSCLTKHCQVNQGARRQPRRLTSVRVLSLLLPYVRRCPSSQPSRGVVARVSSCDVDKESQNTPYQLTLWILDVSYTCTSIVPKEFWKMLNRSTESLQSSVAYLHMQLSGNATGGRIFCVLLSDDGSAQTCISILVKCMTLTTKFPGLLISLLSLFLSLLGLESLQLDMIVVGDAEEGDPVAEEVDGGDGVADDGPGEGDEEPVLDDAGDVHGEGGGLSDEEEDGEVESEGAEGVGDEDEEEIGIRSVGRGEMGGFA
ncbi:hypothetical protein C4D60_Mb08t08810 [Musa balbisiana]|uniref:Uncharacterized protein n=1 Tax=Musa balbisiana TaxID=52838 RepID=A0A4S8K2G9_MUSBA|nr:hypothetical protein C4D60_Mb08t08810 [Musa balbisiana]